ncbi:helix-turn-helix transcriptional regulator [Streptomyces sp. NPDC002055]|uniref:helix-turn-helix transcriptional regulator n=1 Tax=Streptomyces sp. NPDC002055 TaxID=3154534 RepID=UPI00332B5349
MTTGTTTGQRIRTTRHMRQLSAQQLADRVHVSSNYLLKIESGARRASRRILLDLARALHVGIEVLDGLPDYGEAEGQERAQTIIPDLRRVLLTYDSPDDLDVTPRALPVLTAEVDQVSALRRDAAYAEMGPLLPSLVTELTHVALGATGRDQRRAYWDLARVYRAVNSLAHKLGHHDLSNTALDRVRWAADRSGDPLMQVTAGYLVAGAMLRQGAMDGARRKLLGLRAELGRLQSEGCYTASALAVDGGLLLKLAIVEARAGDHAAVRTLLDETREVARMAGDLDVLEYETSFGPTNIRIHEVAALLEIGATEEALARVGEWGRDEGRGLWTPPAGTVGERASHHWIDLAAVQLAEGDRHGSFASLQEARRIAPGHTRFRPQARETVATLVRLDRHSEESLAGMARWMGA